MPTIPKQKKTQFYKLKAGMHMAPDMEWEPDEEQRAVFQVTGIMPRRPEITYKAGEEVESDVDLVEKHGANKFEYIDEGAQERIRRQKDRLKAKTRAEAEAQARERHEKGDHHTEGQPDEWKFKTQGEKDEHPNTAQANEAVAAPGGQAKMAAHQSADVPLPGTKTTQETETKETQQQPSSGQRDASQRETQRTSQQKPTQESLSRMSVRDMQAYAEENQIDLKGATKREDIQRVISRSLKE